VVESGARVVHGGALGGLKILAAAGRRFRFGAKFLTPSPGKIGDLAWPWQVLGLDLLKRRNRELLWSACSMQVWSANPRSSLEKRDGDGAMTTTAPQGSSTRRTEFRAAPAGPQHLGAEQEWPERTLKTEKHGNARREDGYAAPGGNGRSEFQARATPVNLERYVDSVTPPAGASSIKR
jgi:hypothetical protein